MIVRAPTARSVTPTHNRYTFAENAVVDVKLESFAPGKSAMNFYLNGMLFNHKAHPSPDVSLYERPQDLAAAVESWVAGIYENPLGDGDE